MLTEVSTLTAQTECPTKTYSITAVAGKGLVAGTPPDGDSEGDLMILEASEKHICRYDAVLGEIGTILEPGFERAFQEAFANVQIYRVGRSVYARGRKEQKLLAVGFFDGWMMAMRNR